MIAAIKKVATNKAAVPACQSAFFDGNRISVYDLDVYLSIPFKSNHKACIDALRLCTIWETIGQAQDITESTESQVLFVDGKRRFKVANNDYEPFNDLTKGYESMLLIGSIDCDDIQQIKKAASYISGDDLRPVMMAVALIDNCIVSTDSHRMFFSKPKDTLPKEQALLSKKTIDLLHILEPAHWTIYKNDAGAIVLANDGIFVSGIQEVCGVDPCLQGDGAEVVKCRRIAAVYILGATVEAQSIAIDVIHIGACGKARFGAT